MIEEMMDVFPFILKEPGLIALMAVVFLLLRVKGRGASTKKRSETRTWNISAMAAFRKSRTVLLSALTAGLMQRRNSRIWHCPWEHYSMGGI